MTRLCLILAAAFAAALADPVCAETRQALVISTRAEGQEIGQPARDGLQVSRGLLSAGFDVRRLENPASLPDMPDLPPDLMLVYLSADLVVQDGTLAAQLPWAGVPLQEVADLYAGAGQLIILAESCPVAEPDEAASVIPASASPQSPERTIIVFSPGEGKSCDPGNRLTDVFLDLLDQPGADLGDNLQQAGATVLRGAQADQQLVLIPAASAAGEAPDQTIIAVPSQPASAVQVVQPRSVSAVSGGGVRIFNASAPQVSIAGDRRMRPTPDGLPEPSIIVGEMPPADGAEQISGEIEGTTVGVSYEERRRIRDEDAELFTSLLESGAFDPSADQMAAAIQTDLLRMNCYTSSVDGIWGNGSRQAVDRYVRELGQAAVSREADVALFRQVALNDSVRCPAPVARPAAQTNTTATPRRSTNTTTRRSNQTRQSTAPAAPRQPARQATPPAGNNAQPRINPNTLGSGIFR